MVSNMYVLICLQTRRTQLACNALPAVFCKHDLSFFSVFSRVWYGILSFTLPFEANSFFFAYSKYVPKGWEMYKLGDYWTHLQKPSAFYRDENAQCLGVRFFVYILTFNNICPDWDTLPWFIYTSIWHLAREPFVF